MNRIIEIGTAKAAPGQKAQGELFVCNYPDGNPCALPVMIANGAEDGPVLWLNAALHGNELNGVVGTMELFREIDVVHLRGAVVCTPICNPLAFFHKQRLSWNDGLNLGESYPGNTNGQMTERLAAIHLSAVKEYADYFIDFHASGVTHQAKPYAVYKLCGCPKVEEKIEEILRAFGIFVNCGINTLAKTDEPVKLAGSLDIELTKAGIPAFMLEIGNAARLERSMVEVVKEGTRNVMRHFNMIDGMETHATQVFVRARGIIRCTTGGLTVPLVVPYQHLTKDDLITNILDRHGNIIETVTAPEDLYILSVKEDVVVQAGERVVFVAYARDSRTIN